MDKLTIKQEKFIVNVFSGMNQRESYIDAYKAHYAVETIDANASRLARTEKVSQRLAELRERVVSDAIMPVTERQERLSEIGRGRLTDFMTASANGSWIDIGPENKHCGALQEITSRTEYDVEKSNPAVITKVKLHDPIRAIKELNEMDGVYNRPPSGATTVVSNFLFILSDGTRVSPKELMRVEDATEQEED